jgi:hypothetical protein
MNRRKLLKAVCEATYDNDQADSRMRAYSGA